MTLRLAITGANGFIGRAVVRHLEQSGCDADVQLVDQRFDNSPAFAVLTGDLGDPHMVDQVTRWADCIIHLAALPGGAAAADPDLSHRINQQLPAMLMERMAGKRLIYASSVAALGSNFAAIVNDDTRPAPDSVYGHHKHLSEQAFASHVASGQLSGLAIRLPGVVARPWASAGFASAFLSDVFHAARSGSPYILPVAPDATSWMMSAQVCAANLVHAALSDATHGDAVNMPTLTVTIADLLLELAKAHDISGIDHVEQPVIRKIFGSHPPLTAVLGQHLGMRADDDIATLVANVLAHV